MRRAALALLSSVVVAACSAQPPRDAARDRAPLFDNLGTYQFPITTRSHEAQKYFDQGFILSYAFNHAEAIRAFRQAAEIDPTCAMCYWGVAFALGPNINAPITAPAASEAYAAVEEARRRADGITERERGYIEALAQRYGPGAEVERTSLDRAYADAMRDLARRFPDDLDAATLFAQSLMETSPWNYWTNDGTPRPFTNEVLAQLESVLARNPDHPGAIHLYIHAVEASPDPGRAAQYADRLPALVPGAGHLVHMPAHIYLRTGRFDAASLANENAIKADEAYFAGTPVPDNMTYAVGYYPHNMHFLVGAALLALGRAEEAERAFREDLRKFPENGWSLSGLAASLDQRGRARDAAEVKGRLATAWMRADTPLSAGRPARDDRR